MRLYLGRSSSLQIPPSAVNAMRDMAPCLEYPPLPHDTIQLIQLLHARHQIFRALIGSKASRRRELSKPRSGPRERTRMSYLIPVLSFSVRVQGWVSACTISRVLGFFRGAPCFPLSERMEPRCERSTTCRSIQLSISSASMPCSPSNRSLVFYSYLIPSGMLTRRGNRSPLVAIRYFEQSD